MGVDTKRAVKRVLARYCPPLLAGVQTVRRTFSRRRDQRIAERMAGFRQECCDRCDWTVQAGPVRGLRYPTGSRSDTLVPRLAGSYEAEIHPGLEAAIARQPRVVVDVGCEDGYFAVGLALRLPAATVYAFDTDPAARERTREMAHLNGVHDRVVVGGECTPEALEATLRPGSLVFSDCEGYEYELLDPDRVPALRTVDLVVELHDYKRTDVDVTPALRRRFRPTHEAVLVDRVRRDPAPYPAVGWLPPELRPLAVYEPWAPGQQWLVLTVKG